MNNTPKLISKEIRLSASPLSYFFILGAAFCMIPNYPSLVGAFFVCLGIFYSFQNARETNDVLYTVLLPVAKSDAVKAKYLFVLLIQAAAFAAFGVLTLLRVSLSGAPPYDVSALMRPNLVLLGGVLIVFSLFNTVFLCGFYRTAFKIGKPFILFSVFTFLFIAAAETIPHVPGLEQLSAIGSSGFFLRLFVILVCLAIYVASFVLSLNTAKKRFEKVDF